MKDIFLIWRVGDDLLVGECVRVAGLPIFVCHGDKLAASKRTSHAPPNPYKILLPLQRLDLILKP
jgi:hypothetical protein